MSRLDEDYERVKDTIGYAVSKREFKWMSDEQRNELITDMTTPDVEEDIVE